MSKAEIKLGGIAMWELSELDRLHEAIYHRTRVRKFELKPVAPKILKDILRKTEGLKVLSHESKTIFRILEDN